MKPLGEVVRTAQGLVIVRLRDADHPDLGTAVVDQDLAAVGRVVDVFGPVEQPYVAVSPGEDLAPATLLGAKLYAE